MPTASCAGRPTRSSIASRQRCRTWGRRSSSPTGRVRSSPGGPDVSERARFDNAYAAEGFDFSEESIGTNGLGTAIQEDSPVFVKGPEHFNEALEDLACAGIGIRHPATGRLIGSLSLSAPADAAEMMMLAMAREGARQIVDNLSATVGRREVALGRSYQRHRAKGPVIVLNSDTVMTNVTGLSFLNVEMHARLWDALLSQDWDEGPHVLDLDLEALHARVLAHRLDDADDGSFAVEILERKRPGPSRKPAGPTPARDPFVRLLQRTAARRSGALSVTGPSGSGKLHVVREWLDSEGHDRPLVLDAGDLRDRDSWRREATAMLDSGGAVVLRRLEDIDESRLSAVRGLADSLTPAGSRQSAVAARVHGRPQQGSGRRPPHARAGRGRHRGTGAGRPPPGDPVDRAGSAGRDRAARRPVLSAATMQVLLRWDWPATWRSCATCS